MAGKGDCVLWNTENGNLLAWDSSQSAAAMKRVAMAQLIVKTVGWVRSIQYGSTCRQEDWKCVSRFYKRCRVSLQCVVHILAATPPRSCTGRWLLLIVFSTAKRSTYPKIVVFDGVVYKMIHGRDSVAWGGGVLIPWGGCLNIIAAGRQAVTAGGRRSHRG